METSQKPLTYPAARVVMEYLEANIRIALAQRCSHLRAMNHAVPLSIDCLFLGTSRIYINKDLYQLGVYRQYYANSPPPAIQFSKDNDAGGICYDLNEYGDRDIALDKIIGPGEVFVPPSYPETEMTPEEEDQQMERYKGRMAHLKSLEHNEERQQEIEMIEWRVATWEQKKLPAGTLPYTMYLQFTHTSSKGKKVIERLEYSKKMYEAMRYLCNIIFGGRRRLIKCKDLNITSTGGVLRLPPTIRLRFPAIFMGSNVDEVIKSIKPLMDDDLKIKNVGITDGRNLAMNYDHPVIKAAKTLIINQTEVTGQLFHIVLSNTNPRLDVQNGMNTAEELIAVIDKMQRDKREPGTVYSFGVRSEETVKKVLDMVKEKPDCGEIRLMNRGSTRFPDSLCFILTENTFLTVCCNNEMTNGKEPWCLWIRVEWLPTSIKQYLKRDK